MQRLRATLESDRRHKREGAEMQKSNQNIFK